MLLKFDPVQLFYPIRNLCQLTCTSLITPSVGQTFSTGEPRSSRQRFHQTKQTPSWQQKRLGSSRDVLQVFHRHAVSRALLPPPPYSLSGLTSVTAAATDTLCDCSAALDFHRTVSAERKVFQCFSEVWTWTLISTTGELRGLLESGWKSPEDTRTHLIGHFRRWSKQKTEFLHWKVTFKQTPWN